MNTLSDITSLDDIKLLVDTFYDNIRKDTLIGPIFQEKIKDQWSVHLDKMYRFWETILLENHTYSGSPFAPHARMPLEAEHFDRWLNIFYDTLDKLFVGDKASEAKWRAYKMAVMFNSKLEYFRNNENQFPIQ